MTDRLNGCVVVFERDIRVDDVEPMLNAIRHIRGVLSVTGNVTDIGSHIAESRARDDMRMRVYEFARSLSEPRGKT